MVHTQWRLIGVMLGVTCVLGACGGGGGSTAPTPPPCNADTRTCFVRGNGNDTNSGASASSALRQITKAGQLARDGYTIVVGPGSYDGNVTLATLGESANGVRFIGDPTGVQTGDAPGPVLVKPTGANPGFTLSSSPGSIIDGFTISGGGDGGIVVKSGKGGGSDNFTVQNCAVSGNRGDGIRIQDSASALIFNNLVFSNQGNGIVIAGQSGGSTNAHLINNTIVGNATRGLKVGNSSTASPQAYLRNNVIQGNSGDASIKVFTPPPPSVPRSDEGYNADFNLVRPATYQPANVAGVHDIPDDAHFANADCPPNVDPPACVYHLQTNSSAINQGDSLGALTTVDTNGNPARLRDLLTSRTTAGGSTCDQGALDLGYHYPLARGGRCTAP